MISTNPVAKTFFRGNAALLVAAFLCPCTLKAQSNYDFEEGFTEPYQTVRLAAPDAGTIDEFLVREGSHVKRGDIICKLDTQVLDAALVVAKVKAESRGRIASAEASLRHRQNHLKQLDELRSQSHASEQEVTEARLNLSLADAALQTAQDEQKVAQAEVQHIQAQIERRIVRSAIDGIVLELPKHAGESISVTENHVATIVQIDRLKVRMFLSSQQAETLKVGSACTLRLVESDRSIPAIVGFIAPVIDSNSGTVRTELWVENSGGAVRSGVGCVLASDANAKPSQPLPAVAGQATRATRATGLKLPSLPIPTSTRPKSLQGAQ